MKPSLTPSGLRVLPLRLYLKPSVLQIIPGYGHFPSFFFVLTRLPFSWTRRPSWFESASRPVRSYSSRVVPKGRSSNLPTWKYGDGTSQWFTPDGVLPVLESTPSGRRLRPRLP